MAWRVLGARGPRVWRPRPAWLCVTSSAAIASSSAGNEGRALALARKQFVGKIEAVGEDAEGGQRGQRRTRTRVGHGRNMDRGENRTASAWQGMIGFLACAPGHAFLELERNRSRAQSWL